eukprot:gene26635-35308_t
MKVTRVFSIQHGVAAALLGDRKVSLSPYGIAAPYGFAISLYATATGHGIEEASEFQVKVFGRPATTELALQAIHLDEEEPLSEDRSATVSIFSELYRSCIQPHKKRRVEFLGNMVRRSDSLFWRTVAGEARTKIAVADFLHGTLTYLPYDVVDEPLSIIHRINRAVPFGVDAAPKRNSSSNSMPPPNFGEVKRGGQGSTTKKSDEIDTFDHLLFNSQNITQAIHTFTDLKALMCAILELLISAAEARNAESSLRLKAYLKFAYALSDERCLSYNPDLPASTSTSIGGDSNSTNKKAVFDPSFLFSAQPYGQKGNDESTAVVDYKELLAESNVTFILDLCSATCIGKAETARLTDMIVNVTKDYNRMVGSLAGDPTDFTLSVQQAENGKKKQPRQKAKKTPAGTFYDLPLPSSSAGKAKRKRKSAARDDEDNHDDDDDDEEYEDN